MASSQPSRGQRTVERKPCHLYIRTVFNNLLDEAAAMLYPSEPWYGSTDLDNIPQFEIGVRVCSVIALPKSCFCVIGS